MNLSAIYSKTSKGLGTLETSQGKTSQGDADAIAVLHHIDGQTDARNILARMKHFSTSKLEKIINRLLHSGNITLVNGLTDDSSLGQPAIDGFEVEEIISSEFFKDSKLKQQQHANQEQESAASTLNKEAKTIAKIQAAIQATLNERQQQKRRKKTNKTNIMAMQSKQIERNEAHTSILPTNKPIKRSLWEEETDKLSESLRYSESGQYQDQTDARDDSFHVKQWFSTLFSILKSIALSLLVGALILLLLVLLISNIPILMRPFIPPVAQAISEQIREPVNIENMHTSLWPQPKLVLENIHIGDSRDLTLNRMAIAPDLSTLLDDNIAISAIEFSDSVIPHHALGRPVAWAKQLGQSQQPLGLDAINLKAIAIAFGGLQSPAFDGQIDIPKQGEAIQATLSSKPYTTTINISGADSQYIFDMQSGYINLPFGQPFELNNVHAKGSIAQQQLTLTNFNADAYGGKLDGQLIIDWADAFISNGEFNLENMRLADALPHFTSYANGYGQLNTNGTFKSTGDDLAALFKQPEIKANFKINDGEIRWIDIVYAMQTRSKNAAIGGTTQFDFLQGTLSVKDNNYRYQGLTLKQNNISANGSVTIAEDLDLSGNIRTRLTTPVRNISANLQLAGKSASPIKR